MDLRKIVFKLRSYTPIPLLLLLIATATPNWRAYRWGLLLIVSGELIRMWAVAHAGGATRTRNVGAPELVTSGPFAHTRNPLYLVNTLLYVGIAFLAGGELLWVLTALIFSGIQYSLIVSLEEETLKDLFGTDYDFYCRHVPRWRLRCFPWDWSLPRTPNWKDAWRNEKHTRWNILLNLVLFTATWIFKIRIV